MPAQERLRSLPSVDRLLNSAVGESLVAQYGYDAVLQAVRQALDSVRRTLLAGDSIASDEAAIFTQVDHLLQQSFQPTLRPVINATGVIIHTNLGRALLSKSAQQAMRDVASQYNTLEFDLGTGKRGSRLLHAAQLLQEITGAADALVVNNNAAGLVLLLSALAKGREVIISRGQLVEIGGGFRIPDIMAQSGAILVEVGTTNRTRIADYERAITSETALLMRVHSSNFKQIGFTEEASLNDLVALAQRHHLHVVDDLGSGTLLATDDFGLAHEPTVQESLSAGVDLVAFSGDKLLGGPQAGILAGKAKLVDILKHHPLARALRVDKLIYAALTATLDHYRKGEAVAQVPVWWMIARKPEELREIANRWSQTIGGEVIAGESAVGGGSLPGTTLPTWLLALDVDSPDRFLDNLRAAEYPIIARIADNRALFDPRTILPEQEARFLQTLEKVLAQH